MIAAQLMRPPLHRTYVFFMYRAQVPPQYATMRVGPRFSWRDAMSKRNVFKFPLPGTTTYDVVLENATTGDFDFLQSYTATVASIKSPVAFEGSAVELVVDTLLARPSRYNFAVLAVEFNLI